MPSGDEYLADAATLAAELHALDAKRIEVRKRMCQAMKSSNGKGRTQDELGIACSYSRARVGQFIQDATKAAKTMAPA